jgi:hypothetical protein
MRLLENDLQAIRDREARKRGAIAVLENLGYAVQLATLQNQPRSNARNRRPPLLDVQRVTPRDEHQPSNASPLPDPSQK